MVIPCKNCLVLGVCRHKDPLICSMLFNWLQYNDVREWGRIKDYLIGAKTVYNDSYSNSAFIIAGGTTVYEKKKDDTM